MLLNWVYLNLKQNLANPIKNGAYVLKSLTTATQALKSGAHALVTAPIDKHNIQSEAFFFSGHTDYLAKTLVGTSLMLMVADQLAGGLIDRSYSRKRHRANHNRRPYRKKSKIDGGKP